MYRIDDEGREVVVASPSDLVSFLACPHTLTLDRQVAAGERAAPPDDDPELEVLRRRGLDHERAYLERLAAEGLTVVDVDADPPAAGAAGGDVVDAPSSLDRVRARVEATRQAIEAGADIVYQGTFLDEDDPRLWWRGHADFLRKITDAHPDTGRPAYEPEDTKLARQVKPGAVLQLATYAELLERVQGVAPDDLHVVLGGGKEPVTVPMRHAGAYERLARRRFADALADDEPTKPEPVAHCQVCRWRNTCEEQWVAEDHLTLVARLGRGQARKLTDAGIATVAELAALADVAEDERPVVEGMAEHTYEDLVQQARLQVVARTTDGLPPVELRDVDPPDDGGLGTDRGLEALPPPSPGDLYFDIEGDPFVGDHGLEYLFGIGWYDDAGDFRFQPFWGHDADGERAAFEGLVDLVVERRTAHPDLHVYHYAPYEVTALTRLMGRYGTREAEVDGLLRGKVLVDLYQVVRNGLRIGLPSYGLKKLEPLYMRDRGDAIVDAASSIVEYERWLETGDQQILDDIEAYNRTDCESTALLHRWLEERRTEAEARFGHPVARMNPPRDDGAPSEELLAELDRLDALGDRLRTSEADDQPDDQATARHLLADLLHFHRREEKPAWWRFFDRITGYAPGTLDGDPDCLTGLTYEGEVGTEGRSTLHRYRFDPDQEHRITASSAVKDPATERAKYERGEKIPGPGTLVDIDVVEGTLVLKRSKPAPHPVDLIPDEHVPSKPLQAAVEAIATAVADDGIEGPGPHRAVRDLLCGRPPRIAGVTAGEPLRRAGEATLDAASRLVAGLDDSTLAIQGPPGTGKSFTAARVIVDLVAAGKRVGITANSHSVITNLLDQVGEAAKDQGVEVTALQKCDDPARASGDPVVSTASNDEIEGAVAEGSVDVVAGTAWLFARPALAGQIDHLIVDEAGQLSLANVVAAGRAARNLVLVGDPQQLAQPVTGTHPPGVGVSVLEHVLAGHLTVPDDRGLFLDQTWRMHPAITRFVSELAYEERLGSEPSCERQHLGGDGPLSGSGLRWLPVEHDGNRLSSEEEAAHVAALVDGLLDRPWTDRHGVVHGMRLEDVLVVAPYNAQVHLLAQHLPQGARVGTVDRFQGQQAPVVIVSLAASSAEQIPRGMAFLYDDHRLNVAVSRARALTIVVASPALLTAPARTVHQLRLVNGLCRYAELATEVPPLG